VGCSSRVECVAHMSAQWSYGGAPGVAASPRGVNGSCFLFLGIEIFPKQHVPVSRIKSTYITEQWFNHV
jgi:hypothetical protein